MAAKEDGAMTKMTKAEIDSVLAEHRKWFNSNGNEGSCADLSDADLSGADLSDADLTDAVLRRADLSDAYLGGAILRRADFSGAVGVDPACLPGPPSAEESDRTAAERARLRSAPRAERAAAFRATHPDVPVVECIDAKILAAIEAGGRLDMSNWHSCETTHCRAGWAITLAGAPGAALEAKYGAFRAGHMIYRASTGRAPHFFATDERALADIRRCAAEQATTAAEETGR